MKDGGRAFPRSGYLNKDDADWSGMSLRDYFAAAALPAIVAHLAPIPKNGLDKDSAIAAYAIADAMLAERDK